MRHLFEAIQAYRRLQAWAEEHFEVLSHEYHWSAQDYYPVDGLPALQFSAVLRFETSTPLLEKEGRVAPIASVFDFINPSDIHATCAGSSSPRRART